jgi:hypothetical protein
LVLAKVAKQVVLEELEELAEVACKQTGYTQS